MNVKKIIRVKYVYTNNTKISMHWPKKIHARYTHANLIPSVFSIALI